MGFLRARLITVILLPKSVELIPMDELPSDTVEFPPTIVELLPDIVELLPMIVELLPMIVELLLIVPLLPKPGGKAVGATVMGTVELLVTTASVVVAVGSEEVGSTELGTFEVVLTAISLVDVDERRLSIVEILLTAVVVVSASGIEEVDAVVLNTAEILTLTCEENGRLDMVEVLLTTDSKLLVAKTEVVVTEELETGCSTSALR